MKKDFTMYGFIFAILFLMATVYFYNSLVDKKNQVDNIYSGINVVLKKRYDLIPALVSVVKRYMEYEKGILESIVQLRNQATNPEINEKETLDLDKKITLALSSVMMRAEQYPDLKANINMLQLQETLTELEAQISGARRAYNQAVTDYNSALEMIPTNIISNIMKYKPRVLFEIESNQKESHGINHLSKSTKYEK